MRWKDNYPEIGDKKIVQRFAYWPIWIDGETRWLERVKYKMEYQNEARQNRHGDYIYNGWVRIKWIEDDMEKIPCPRNPPLPPPYKTIKEEVKK